MNNEHTISITDTEGNTEDFIVYLDKPFIIGRSTRCDVSYPQDGLSREHLKIEFDQNKFILHDLGGMNGTFVDEEKIPKEQSVDIYSFSRVRIADLYVLDLNFDNLPVMETTKISSTFTSLDSPFSKPEPSLASLEQTLKAPRDKLSGKKRRSRDRRSQNDKIKLAIIITTIIAGLYVSKGLLFPKKIKVTNDVSEQRKQVAKAPDENQTQNKQTQSESSNIAPSINFKILAKKVNCKGELNKRLCLLFSDPKKAGYGFFYIGNKIIGNIDYSRLRSKFSKYPKHFQSNIGLKTLVLSMLRVDTLKRFKRYKIEQLDIYLTTPFFSSYKTIKYVKVNLKLFFESVAKITTFEEANKNPNQITFSDTESFIKMQQSKTRQSAPEVKLDFKSLVPYLQRSITITP